MAETTAEDLRSATTLGRTGVRVGRLGIGGSYGVPAAAVEKAFREYGVNYFYWGSIRRGGMRDAIRSLARESRERIVLALQSYDRTGRLMGPFLDRGLRALGIDYADVLILGWYDSRPPARILDAALRLRDAGKLRYIAISGHNRPLFAELAAEGAASPYDVLMFRYNAAHRGAEREVFPSLTAPDRPGVTCYTATRWGQLLDPKRMPPGERPLAAADCYRFVLSNPLADLCMTGPASADEMDGALRALDLGPLSGEEMERARRIGDFVRNGP